MTHGAMFSAPPETWPAHLARTTPVSYTHLPLLAAIAGMALTEIFYASENLGGKKAIKDLVQ